MSTVYYDNINGFSQLKMENNRLYGRLNSGDWTEIETGGEPGEPGADGLSSYVYIAWCSDPATGANFSLTTPADYISFLSTNTQLASPQFNQFSHWAKYIGTDGDDGTSTYVYYAYASDASGTNFSLSPADGLNFQAILVTHTELASPSLADFAGLFYQYKAIFTVGHNIFDIFYSMSSTTPPGAMDLSLGTLIASCNTVFPDFWDACVSRKADGSIRTLTEDEWQAEVAANGSCGAFVVDETAMSVRLPKITHMIQPGDVGEFTEAGLPEIVARALLRQLGSAGNIFSYATQTGAFSISNDSSTALNTITGTVTSGIVQALDFSAQKSNAIYGNSSTVQPPAVGAKLYIQVYTSAVPASVAQAAEFINMLETKADKTELSPTGTVIAFAGNSAPAGYLICNGAAVSRTTYASLFAVIGTTYGTGDGSTTFNLPNLTDRFIQGSGTAGTSKGAGLPNITGSTASATGNYGVMVQAGFSGTGAFYGNSQQLTAWLVPAGNTQGLSSLSFDASKSSSIYGNSTTVQPPALTMRYYIKY